MALSYVALMQLANNTTFQQRVQFAVYRAANQVRKEVDTTPNHAKRLAWALEALRGPVQNQAAVMNLVLTTGAVFNTGEAVDDTQLQNVVDGLVDAFAG